jgi:MFS family permease
MTKNIKYLLAASSGSLFETFDFYLFSLFSIFIHQTILGEDFNTTMIWIFLIFASGYFSRIIGALFFGYIGDKYGRSYSFRFTILIIALSSIGIGFTPTYNTIGIFSIILLFVFRIAQGFSYGGELSGAIVMVYENSTKHRGLYCSIILIFASFGFIIANLCYTGLEYWLNSEQIVSFGWRIAFICGGLIILHSYFARVTLYESRVFKKIKSAKKNKKAALRQIAKNYKALMIFVFFTQAGIASYWGILVAYLPVYCAEYYEISTIKLSEMMLIMSICIPIGTMIGGLIADWIGIKNAYLVYSVIMLIIIMPVYNYIINDAKTMIEIFIIMGGFSLLTGLMHGTANYFSTNSFPAEIRYSSVAIIQNIGMAVFAGLAPLYVSSLTHYFNDIMIPAKVLTINYAIQVIAILIVIFYCRNPLPLGRMSKKLKTSSLK